MLLEIDLDHCELITDGSVRLSSTHPSFILMREMCLSRRSLLTDVAFLAPVKPDVQLDAPSPFSTSTIIKNDLPPLVINWSFEHLRTLDLTASLITDEAIEGTISHAPKIWNLVEMCQFYRQGGWDHLQVGPDIYVIYTLTTRVELQIALWKPCPIMYSHKSSECLLKSWSHLRPPRSYTLDGHQLSALPRPFDHCRS